MRRWNVENLEGWIAKGEVIARTGLDERTIERKVNRGELRRQYRPIPGRKPLPVFDPQQVEALCTRTLTPIPLKTAGVVKRTPAEVPAPLFVPVHRKLFLSIKEAVALTGLPESYLRRNLREQKIPGAVVGGRWMVKRNALEQHELVPSEK
jgi:excisionase family DNA binding protein